MVHIHESCFVCQDVVFREPPENIGGSVGMIGTMGIGNKSVGLISPRAKPLSALMSSASSFLKGSSVVDHVDQKKISFEVPAITVGEGTIISPKCVFECGSTSKGIHIGKYNIIEEGVSIINLTGGLLKIGDYNFIRAGTYICGRVRIGNYNILDCKSKCLNDAVIEDYCVLNPLCCLGDSSSNSFVPSFTIVLGSHCTRKSCTNQKDKLKAIQEQQINQHLATLRNILPNYHKSIKM